MYLFVLHRLAGKCTKIYNACRTIVRLRPLVLRRFRCLCGLCKISAIVVYKSHEVDLSVFFLLLYLWFKLRSHWKISSEQLSSSTLEKRRFHLPMAISGNIKTRFPLPVMGGNWKRKRVQTWRWSTKWELCAYFDAKVTMNSLFVGITCTLKPICLCLVVFGCKRNGCSVCNILKWRPRVIPRTDCLFKDIPKVRLSSKATVYEITFATGPFLRATT